jgi:hypothetical protein
MKQKLQLVILMISTSTINSKLFIIVKDLPDKNINIPDVTFVKDITRAEFKCDDEHDLCIDKEEDEIVCYNDKCEYYPTINSYAITNTGDLYFKVPTQPTKIFIDRNRFCDTYTRQDEDLSPIVNFELKELSQRSFDNKDSLNFEIVGNNIIRHCKLNIQRVICTDFLPIPDRYKILSIFVQEPYLYILASTNMRNPPLFRCIYTDKNIGKCVKISKFQTGNIGKNKNILAIVDDIFFQYKESDKGGKLEFGLLNEFETIGNTKEISIKVIDIIPSTNVSCDIEINKPMAVTMTTKIVSNDDTILVGVIPVVAIISTFIISVFVIFYLKKKIVNYKNRRDMTVKV